MKYYFFVKRVRGVLQIAAAIGLGLDFQDSEISQNLTLVQVVTWQDNYSLDFNNSDLIIDNNRADCSSSW